jgi:acetylornithine deacetylase/succinyl-diaminopimelate desuccinylase-like protein
MTSVRSAKPFALRTSCLSSVALLLMAGAVGHVRAQSPDEATRLLQEYVRIDTSNPPGDTRKAADFLASILAREGIPTTRYESEPGKAIVYASTISLTWFRSGVGDPPKINVIPSVAEAGLDCRVLPGIGRDPWISDVKRRLGDPSLKVELISESDDPVVTSRDTALYRNLDAAITRLHRDAIVTPILVPYGTDSNAFRPKGVKSYGFSRPSCRRKPARRCTATQSGFR